MFLFKETLYLVWKYVAYLFQKYVIGYEALIKPIQLKGYLKEEEKPKMLQTEAFMCLKKYLRF
jgi:hypothetical protein